MKQFIIIILSLLIAANAYAYCKDEKKCAEQKEQRSQGSHPGLASGVGGTAAAGLLAAPYGATAALSSMGLAGGFSLFTGALTNSDIKMYVNFRNKAAKVIEKKKDHLSCQEIKTGEYERVYGNCKDSAKTFKIVKADELYSNLKDSEQEVISSWEKIHSGETAYFITDEHSSRPALVFYNKTIIAFDETGKNVVCTGQIKPATHNNNIVLYCRNSNDKFCNKVYEVKE